MNDHLSRSLTVRYGIAIACTATGMLIAYLLIVTQIKAAAKDSDAINTSGLQRMLSQRIALKLVDAGDAQGLAAAQREVPDLIVQMRQAQRSLSAGDPVDDTVHGRADRLLDRYLSTASAVLLADDERAAVAGQTVREMATGDELLEALDDVVTAYQQRAESRVRDFERLEGWLLTLGLLVLLIEVALIFRPMTRMIARVLADLQRRNEEARQFAYRISHDLRGPIVSSVGIVDVARDAIAEGDHEEAATALTHIDRSLHRLLATISKLTTLLRNQQQDESPQKISIGDLVADARERLDDLPGYDRIDWRISISDDTEVHCRRVVLQTIVENLISNAIRYRDPEVDSWVAIEVVRHRTDLLIVVEDNGLEIAPQFHCRVFEMFERFHPEVCEGSGLGLYLIAENARALGGVATYQSTDVGSRFEVRLPV